VVIEREAPGEEAGVDGGTAGVLIVGAYLSGKSSVAAEIADVLEGRGDAFALIDLDYLGWASVPGYDGHGDDPWLLLENLRAVRENDVAAGVRRFVVAGHVADGVGLDRISSALDMPVTVVRLEVPIEELERRAAAGPTAGRGDDLAEARLQLAAGSSGIEDAVVRNDRPIRETALEVLGVLGWA